MTPLFFGFRLMVGIGTLMLLLSWVAAWQSRKSNVPTPIIQKSLVAMTFSGWIATLAGWYVTEIGRQPWLVQGILRTADAVSPVPASNLALTLTVYLILYTGLIIAYISTLFYLARRADGTTLQSIPPSTLKGAPDYGLE